MILKEAVYSKKRITRMVLISDEVCGCDCCKKEISGKKYSATIFYAMDENISLDFCSLSCCFKYIKNCDIGFDFISMPFIGSENIDEFISLLK